jgi:ribosomal-protein-alanine N-acetyltransferase
MKIVLGSTNDAKEVAALEHACFKSFWNEQDIKNDLENNAFSHLLLAYEEDELVGYLLYWQIFEQTSIVRIGTDPAYRNRHVASLLFQNMEKEAASQGVEFLNLEVRKSNLAAIAFYEKMGMSKVNEVEGYYSDGENALVYCKSVEG